MARLYISKAALIGFGLGIVAALCVGLALRSQFVKPTVLVKEQKLNNPGVYFEIPATDLPRAMQFYQAVFGYTFEQVDIHGNQMANLPFTDQATGITGALAKGEIYKPSVTGTLIYLHSSNIDETLKKANAAGGTTLFPKTAVGGLGYSAEIKDSEGNRVGLFETKS
jgi:uncharacterized protein